MRTKTLQPMHSNAIGHRNDKCAHPFGIERAGEIEKSSRWTIARLIASSVEPSQAGRPAKNLGPRTEISKLSIIAAAEVMSRSEKTIRAYLNAWNAAAAAPGKCW